MGIETSFGRSFLFWEEQREVLMKKSCDFPPERQQE